jgi:hypothetical protein
VKPWVNTLLGAGLLGYTWYWVENPSRQGLGRILRLVSKTWGKWPVAILLAAGGLTYLSIGLTGIVRRHRRRH